MKNITKKDGHELRISKLEQSVLVLDKKITEFLLQSEENLKCEIIERMNEAKKRVKEFERENFP